MKKFSSCYKANIKVEDYFNQEMKCLKCGFCDNRMLWIFALILQMFFILVLFKKCLGRHSCCAALGLAVSWDFGLIPGPAQCVKDPALLQLQLRLQRRRRSDPWPGIP